MVGIIARRDSRGFKSRVVRLLADSRANYSSGTKTLQGVGKGLGIATESLRRWQGRTDMSHAAGPGESEELRRLRRENAELRRGNGISGSVSAFCVSSCQVEVDWVLFPVVYWATGVALV
jgi:transposase